VRKVYFLHSRSVGSDGQRDRLKAMQEPLRELKCENDANVTGFCTMNPAGAQFDHFEALGRNSQTGSLRPRRLVRPSIRVRSSTASSARSPHRPTRNSEVCRSGRRNLSSPVRSRRCAGHGCWYLLAVTSSKLGLPQRRMRGNFQERGSTRRYQSISE
jgi:hypothetical protein